MCAHKLCYMVVLLYVIALENINVFLALVVDIVVVVTTTVLTTYLIYSGSPIGIFSSTFLCTRAIPNCSRELCFRKEVTNEEVLIPFLVLFQEFSGNNRKSIKITFRAVENFAPRKILSNANAKCKLATRYVRRHMRTYLYTNNGDLCIFTP